MPTYRGPDKIDVNARCLAGVDPNALTRRTLDGRHWEDAMHRERS